MVTILFIDDLRNPNTVIQNLGGKKIVCANNYEAAIQALNDYTFDIVTFDHDLGEDKTGYNIAKYIVEHQIKINNGFRIHSANSVGRFNIYQLLTHYGYKEVKSYE